MTCAGYDAKWRHEPIWYCSVAVVAVVIYDDDDDDYTRNNDDGELNSNYNVYTTITATTTIQK